jgi:hypothetical protein
MRITSKSFKFVIRFGTMFSQVSCIILILGIVLFFNGLRDQTDIFPIAVALLLIGSSLLYISVLLSNKKLKLLEKGKLTIGTYKEWRNSFFIRNNQALVYLIYTYFDDKHKKKETYTLSTSTEGHEKVHIFYNDRESFILEYLPGTPNFVEEQNKFEINLAPTIVRYMILLLITCVFIFYFTISL